MFVPEYYGTPALNSVSEGISAVSLTEKMLSVSMERECRSILVGLRPPKEKRFSGDTQKIEFEAHLHAFQRAMKVEGVSDAIIVNELAHWFCGNAASICNLFYFETDATKQLKLILEELTKYYGSMNITAESLLERLLKGRGDQGG